MTIYVLLVSRGRERKRDSRDLVPSLLFSFCYFGRILPVPVPVCHIKNRKMPARRWKCDGSSLSRSGQSPTQAAGRRGTAGGASIVIIRSILFHVRFDVRLNLLILLSFTHASTQHIMHHQPQQPSRKKKDNKSLC
jgi:hypothetical protein